MKALSQPLFASLRGYDRAQLGPDLFSGVLIALLSIPISMGYAQLAGLPPVYGLYGSLVPILLFAMLSTTREFIFGVDAAPAAMIGAVLASLGVTPGGAEAMRIVPVLTLYVALWLAVFALVHADKAVDYISEPVMGGFISGVCCEIILMQVPKLLGSATGTGELFELLGHVFDAAKVINWPTAALGFGTLAILLIAPRKWPKVPWVLVMMVLGGLLGAFAPLDDWGVALLAAVLTGERPELDMQRVVLMCLIHDLGEAFDGDVPAIAQTAPGVKAASELAAMERLTRLLPPEAGATIREIWEEYEACQTPEARWVKALDKAETIIQHNQGANPAGFDYAFNLTYGSEYFDDGALLSDLRLLLDEETGRHVRR